MKTSSISGRLCGAVCAALLLCTNSCISENYDDSPLLERLSGQQKQLDDQKRRLDELDGQYERLSGEVAVLNALMKTMQGYDHITSVRETEGGGFEINFEKAGKMTVRDGRDGSDGVSPEAPVIGIDADGFWTVNGKSTGVSALPEKPGTPRDGRDGADGRDGVTPLFKVEDGDWMVSYDEGATWENVGKATGADGVSPEAPVIGIDEDGFWTVNGESTGVSARPEDGKDGDSLFSDISVNGDGTVSFTLSDGTRFTFAVAPEPKILAQGITLSGDKLTVTVEGVSFNMIRIPKGSFTLGTDDPDRYIWGANGAFNGNASGIPENTAVRWTFDEDFWIGETKVTDTLARVLTGKGGVSENQLVQLQTGSQTQGVLDKEYYESLWTGEHPCVASFWKLDEKSEAFYGPAPSAEELTGRLEELTGLHFTVPTQPQWEYAARGADKSKGYRYSGSDDLSLYDFTLKEVKRMIPNEAMVYDCTGNGYEMTSTASLYSNSLSREKQESMYEHRSSYLRVVNLNDFYLPRTYTATSWSSGTPQSALSTPEARARDKEVAKYLTSFSWGSPNSPVYTFRLCLADSELLKLDPDRG